MTKASARWERSAALASDRADASSKHAVEPPPWGQRRTPTTRAQRHHTQAARHRSVGVHQRRHGPRWSAGLPNMPRRPRGTADARLWSRVLRQVHASVQRAANRLVNCPCCLRPVAPTELPTEVHVEAAERKTAASSSTVEAPAGAWRLGQRSRFSRAAARLKARCCRCDLSGLDAAAFAMAVADVLCMVPSLL